VQVESFSPNGLTGLRRFLVLLTAASALLAWGSPTLFAQSKGPDPIEDENGYKVLPPFAKFVTDRAAEVKVKAQVRGVIDGRNELSEFRTYFDSYYRLHYFPMMTQTNEKALQELPEERFRFIRDHLEGCKNDEVHEHIIDLALANLVPIVQDNFHPAVRYNALLIIGSLNQTEAVRIGDVKATPEPHSRALPILYSEFTKAENPDLLKVAALIGLVRHLEWDPYRATPIPPAQRTAVLKALLDLATQKQPPEGRSEDGHAWMRRRAIEGLGHSGAVKAEANVVAALEDILKSDEEPIEVRVAAASAIGRSNYVAPLKLDVAATVRELGRLAVLSCVSELDRAASIKKSEEERMKILSAQPGSSYGSSGMYGEGSGYSPSSLPSGGGLLGKPEDPKGYRLDPLRQRIRARLYGVQTGLTGPADDRANTTRGAANLAKTQAEKDAVKTIRDHVEKVIVVLEGTPTDLASLDIELRKNLKPLDDLTRRAKPAAAPAGEDVPGAIPGPGEPPGAEAAPPTAGKASPATRPAVRPTAASAAPAATVPPAARP
jgi:hypothetical protein